MADNRLMLVDWVLDHWQESLAEVIDARLEGKYDADEATLALKLGLLCSHPLPGARPSMRPVMQYLDGDMPFPELTPAHLSFSTLALMRSEGFDSFVMSASHASTRAMSIGTMTGLSGGR
ncbi:hypothetical protein C2845_PM01G26760 [Panicum miliaceum]|uniref:Uncharacterized protein n=1 Tax=Panicum miliaceum TaxID=4540 RepID=A0A3L6TG65_PANMI|nr:hypothetical protein C2845_PM01G26760 [Panicum miliaceum]